jgi:uncharacterized protein (TIGR02145 family)
MKSNFLLLTLAILFIAISSLGQETGTFTDSRDGKIYITVKIGTQTWFAENLAYKTNKGCVAYAQNDSNITKYGYLYDFEAAKMACPSGWHLPSKNEWFTLLNYLGGDSIAGMKLKLAGEWKNSPNNRIMGYKINDSATNESGFSALPAGYLMIIFDEGMFGLMGSSTQFWSGVKSDGGFKLLNNISNVIAVDESFMGRSSVRCIKN